MPDPWGAAAIVLVGLVLLASHAVEATRASDDSPTDPIDREHQRYVDGEIDHETFERRAGALTDYDRRAVYDLVQDVDWTGHDVALRVAMAFESADELAAADQEEIEAVHGVGESIAEEVQRRA